MDKTEQQLRKVIHDMANAFARLNAAVTISNMRPEAFDHTKLETERVGALAKFNTAMDAIPRYR